MEKITSPLVEGTFTSAQAIALITELYDVKIRFHESMIQGNTMEEDIKMRERKIKSLQDIRANLIASVKASGNAVVLQSWMELSR
ncbi:MAG: hypothetical protein ACKOSR_13770 [Flavobacteriales bacterium]